MQQRQRGLDARQVLRQRQAAGLDLDIAIAGVEIPWISSRSRARSSVGL
ncbi:hypothetical protein WJ966_27305 [Achromobacter xylosoxidans]